MGDKTTFAKLIQDYIIEIPRIQRDYVQGRAITPEEMEKRDEFVNSLISALEDSRNFCVLDFVYGYIKGEKDPKTFIPLDGQQRLSSLYLLHWFLIYSIYSWQEDSVLCKKDKDDYIHLLNDRFVYSNRISSTEFCKRITAFDENAFNFEIKGAVIDVLKQQAWFDDEWVFDPTIETMLSMLEIYESKLKEKSPEQISSMAKRLFEEEAIFFDRLDLEKLHQGESLYVKMNARGKKLTQFENWKSKFTKMLDDYYNSDEFEDGDITRCGNLKFKDYFSYSVEHEWNDFFWRFVTKDISVSSLNDVTNTPYPTVDRPFSNFLKVIHSLLFFKDRNDSNAKATDFQWTFAQNLETYGKNKKDNLIFLFQCLDFIAALPDGFFDDLFYTTTDNLHEDNKHKVRYYGEYGTDLLTLAIGSYDNNGTIVNNLDDSSRFDLMSTYLLYAVLSYCAPKYCKNRQTPPVVDDSLRYYIRNCRNYLETINQFLTAKVSLSPNLRLVDASERIKVINGCQNIPQYSDEQVQCLFEWLGDVSYVGGKASAFVPILNRIQSGNSPLSIQMIKVFMMAFEKAPTLQRAQMLIGAGYPGKKQIGGVADNRERYFFGQNVRWNVLFVEDSAIMADILSKLIFDYYQNKDDVTNLLDYYRKSVPVNSFRYYMLKYDYALWAPNDPSTTITDDRDGAFFFAVAGKPDEMDLIALKSISAQPLSAYHIDPLVCAVIHACPNYQNRINFIGRFGTKQGIGIKINSEDVFELTATANGWSAKTDKIDLVNRIVAANKNLSYDNNVFQLQTAGVLEMDKVVIGKAILETIASCLNW